MPGSPPTSVTEPGDEAAAEHPVELGDSVGSCAAPAVSTSAIGIGAVASAPRRTARRPRSGPPEPPTRPNEPHSPHSVQRPSHFGDS